MPQAIRLTGVRPLIAKLRAFQAALPGIMEAATFEAVEFVKTNANAELTRYFNEPRGPYEPEPTDAIFQAWEVEIRGIGAKTLLNTHPAAAYIEFGTKDHPIDQHAGGPLLSFIDPDSGEFREEEHVYVSGIEDTAFLSDAVRLYYREIWAIYEQHLWAAMQRMAI